MENDSVITSAEDSYVPATRPVDNNEIQSIGFIENLNYSIILLLATAYAFKKLLFGSKRAEISIVRRRLQVFGSLVLCISLFFYFIFFGTLTFLNQTQKIDRHAVELLKAFEGSYIISYKSYSVDAVAVMIYALKMSQILLYSSIFFIAAILSLESKKQLRSGDFADETNSSVGIFSIFWALCRIPMHLYLDAYRSGFSEKVGVFVFETAGLAELLTASLLIVIARPRKGTAKKDSGFIAFILFLFAIFKHGTNVVDAPYAKTPLCTQIISSTCFSLEIGLFLLLLGSFCSYDRHFYKQAKGEVASLDDKEESADVVLIQPVVEFDDRIAVRN